MGGGENTGYKVMAKKAPTHRVKQCWVPGQNAAGMMLGMSPENSVIALGFTFQPGAKIRERLQSDRASPVAANLPFLQGAGLHSFFEGGQPHLCGRPRWPTGLEDAPSPAMFLIFLQPSDGLSRPRRSCASRCQLRRPDSSDPVQQIAGDESETKYLLRGNRGLGAPAPLPRHP